MATLEETVGPDQDLYDKNGQIQTSGHDNLFVQMSDISSMLEMSHKPLTNNAP